MPSVPCIGRAREPEVLWRGRRKTSHPFDVAVDRARDRLQQARRETVQQVRHEHLATRDGQDAPGWSASRGLRRFWFPFDTPGARAQALVHAPAAFRRRGVFVADYEIDAA